MKKTIAVDLDATLAKYSAWQGVLHIGNPLPGAIEFVEKLSEFANVLIYTTRCTTEVNKESATQLKSHVKSWLDKHGFNYYDIWIGQGKPVCAAIVDDRAVTCRPQESETAYDRALTECKQLCHKD